MVFDIYVIGDSSGFYVGQALRKRTGGWERRIREHRKYKSGCLHARKILEAGAPVWVLGSFCSERQYAGGVEARAWDHFCALGWLPVHRRPRNGTNYIGALGHTRTPAERQNHKEACARRSQDPAYRQRLREAALSRYGKAEERERAAEAMRDRWQSPDTREKMVAGVARGAVKKRGRKLSKEHRKKLSDATRGRPKSEEWREKRRAAWKRQKESV